MSHLHDLGKVASGLAMVVKESLKRAPRLRPDSVAMDALKAVTGTVTDLTGLTQGRVKDVVVPSRDLGFRPSQGEDGTERASGHVSTSGRGSSYLLDTLDSLGPSHRSRHASNRTDEVLSKVKKDVLPAVADTPLSKPLENFTSADSNCLDKTQQSPAKNVSVRVPDRKEENQVKLDGEAVKAEQVLQASRIGGAFHPVMAKFP